jgi:hypothetical protein
MKYLIIYRHEDELMMKLWTAEQLREFFRAQKGYTFLRGFGNDYNIFPKNSAFIMKGEVITEDPFNPMKD